MSNATANSSRRIKLRKDPTKIDRSFETRTADPFWPAGARARVNRNSVDEVEGEGGFNFRRVLGRIKSCKRIFLSALLENWAGLLSLYVFT